MTCDCSLEEALESLGLTQSQQRELLQDPDRTQGWVVWLREQGGVMNPAGLLISRFRSGIEPPDPNAWRGDAEPAAGPNYSKLLRACEQLVEATGYEYRDEDLLEEFARIGRLAKVGNGASLTDVDRGRLLRTAATMRSRYEAGEPEREAARRRWAAQHYAERVRRGKAGRGELEAAERVLGAGFAAEVAALVAAEQERAGV